MEHMLVFGTGMPNACTGMLAHTPHPIDWDTSNVHAPMPFYGGGLSPDSQNEITPVRCEYFFWNGDNSI